jgi:hypothetical protein
LRSVFLLATFAEIKLISIEPPLSAYWCSAKYSILVKIWLCFGTQLCSPRDWGNIGQHSWTVQSWTFQVFEGFFF